MAIDWLGSIISAWRAPTCFEGYAKQAESSEMFDFDIVDRNVVIFTCAMFALPTKHIPGQEPRILKIEPHQKAQKHKRSTWHWSILPLTS